MTPEEALQRRWGYGTFKPLQREAVEMYTRNNLWGPAHKVAQQYRSEQEISALYINQAQQCEVCGNPFPGRTRMFSTSFFEPKVF